MNTERCKIDLTNKLLWSISSHLYNSDGKNRLEYVVCIGTEEDENAITISPMSYIFPNRYRRCERDRVSLIYHVLIEHVPELPIIIDDKDDEGHRTIHVDTSKLVKGKYIYKYSISGKSRRWTREA